MKRHKSNAVLKDLAKEKLTGKFSHALFALFLVDMISRTVSSVAASFLPSGGLFWSIVALLFTSLISVFLGILQTGIAYFFLNVACNRTHSYSNIVYGFQECSEKSIKISAVHTIANTICLLPYQILLLLFLQTFRYTYLAIACIALIIGYIILTPLSLAISQAYYLLLDFPDASAEDIIKTSIRIMKGHKLRLFLLDLSFLPLYLLCILTFGIGFLWLHPYMRMTYTLFFLDLMNPEEKNTAKTGTDKTNNAGSYPY